MTELLTNFGYFLQQNPTIFIVFALWELGWKGFALWKSARNNQRNWFVGLLIINSVGILPILYLKFFQKEIKK